MVVMMVILVPVRVSVVIAVPTVVMLDSAAVAFPIAGKKLFAIVMGRDPSGSFIRRASPIPVVPFVMTTDRIPIAFDPHISGPWTRRKSVNHAR
jgi:hypothetical protein